MSIQECSGCKQVFSSSETKHHCRACGQGFCHDCSDYLMPVPEKGWGITPVKVCGACSRERMTSENGMDVEEMVVIDTR